MAPRNPLSSVLAALGLTVMLLGAGSAAAQSKPPAGIQVYDSDCAKIPGGNAPIERISRLSGAMSVRNLEFTYFGKPLHTLTQEDYDTIRAIWRHCKTFSPEVADAVLKKLKAKVDDAKAARRDALAWIEATKIKAMTLKPGAESIRWIHGMWQEMLNREFEMLKSDLDHLAQHLTEWKQVLYASHEPHQRILVSPFDPGPP
ncbi:MAG: hypothetical protein HQ481_04485 [Alphaproteobacteria bacterium]|nr:hypothetical protein [Alphaproteobacteria bacterium]